MDRSFSYYFVRRRNRNYYADPFENRPTDVPMTALSNTIENNIIEIITDQKVEITAKPKSFYINWSVYLFCHKKLRCFLDI